MPTFWTREEYYQKTGVREKQFWREGCPFCSSEPDPDFILWTGKHWMIWYNKYPYTGNDQHIMAIPREHKKFFSDLIPEEVAELSDVHAEAKRFFWETPYFSFARETDCDISKSIEHYHIHFIGSELQWKYLRKMLQDQGFPVKQELS